jgi:hypothetical protein
MASTFSPDPNHLLAGAGTATQQETRSKQVADPANGGWDPLASTAVAGTPGSWGPAGAAAPNSLAECAGVTASPATAWVTPSYVLLRDGTSHVHWTGTAWANGNGSAAVQANGGKAQQPAPPPEPPPGPAPDGGPVPAPGGGDRT